MPQFLTRQFVISFYLPQIIFSTCGGLLIPVLPLFAAELGAPYWLIGVVLALDPFGTMIGDVPAGLTLRRFPTKTVILLGTLGVLLATGLLFFADSILPVLFLRFSSGFFRALYGVAQHTYLAQQIPMVERGRAIALFGGAFRVGSFLGPAMGGAVGLAFGLRAVFVVFALLMLVSLLGAFLFMPASPKKAAEVELPLHPSLRQILAQSKQIFLVAGAGQLFAQMIRAGRTTLLPLYAADILGLDVAAIGTIISLGTAMDVLMVYPAGMIMDRVGRKWAIVPCFGLQAVGMLLLPLTTSIAGLAVVNIFMGFSNGLGSGTMMTLGSDLAPPEVRGEFLGVWRFIGDIGFSGGPLLVGSIADILILPAAAVAVAASGFTAALIFGLGVPETLKKRKREAEAAF